MINLIFEILFLKILFRAYNVFTFVQTFQWTSSELFLISDFLEESLRANKNKIAHFTVHFRSKNHTHLRTSTHLTLKLICSRYSAKNFSDFTNFTANKFLFGVRKNICTTPFFDAQELHSWSILKANVGIYLFISLILFQRRSKILSSGEGGGDGWLGGRLNNFLRVAHCLGLAKCFRIFHIDWNFWKFNYFFSISILIYFQLSI